MISIVTPSLNQGDFLEAAMQSVLTQDVDVEYVVIDGGLDRRQRRHHPRHRSELAAWRSEPDGGQYDALNKGFALTSGEIMGWLNADDFYFPGGLSVVEDRLRPASGDRLDHRDDRGDRERARADRQDDLRPVASAARAFFRGFNLPFRGWHGRALSFRRSRRSGAVRSGSAPAGGSIASLDDGRRLRSLGALLPSRRALGGAGAARRLPQPAGAEDGSSRTGRYLDEAESVLRRHGGDPYGKRESSLRDWLGARVGRLRLSPSDRGAGALEERGLVYRTPELVWKDAWHGWQHVLRLAPSVRTRRSCRS